MNLNVLLSIRLLDDKMVKPLNFVFSFPPIHGVFDTEEGLVYVFGELHENAIEDIIGKIAK